MQLTVIGSSDAFNSAGRFHACYWLEGLLDAPLMVDFGSTALVGIRRAHKSADALGTVVITHLHGDHIGGLPHLLINAMYNEVRTAPLHLLGPVNLEGRVERYFEDAYPGLSQRPRPYALSFDELPPGRTVPLGTTGATLSTFAASHMDPPERPLCLRFTAPDGTSVAFSGDTEFCPGLFAAADGADLLVAECTALAPPAGRHMTWKEWREQLPKVGAKRILLTHFNAQMRACLADLRAELPADSGVDFAEDGMVLNL